MDQVIKLVSPDHKLGRPQAASFQMVRSGKSALLEQAPANLTSLARMVRLSKRALLEQAPASLTNPEHIRRTM